MNTQTNFTMLIELVWINIYRILFTSNSLLFGFGLPSDISIIGVLPFHKLLWIVVKVFNVSKESPLPINLFLGSPLLQYLIHVQHAQHTFIIHKLRISFQMHQAGNEEVFRILVLFTHFGNVILLVIFVKTAAVHAVCEGLRDETFCFNTLEVAGGVARLAVTERLGFFVELFEVVHENEI